MRLISLIPRPLSLMIPPLPDPFPLPPSGVARESPPRPATCRLRLLARLTGRGCRGSQVTGNRSQVIGHAWSLSSRLHALVFTHTRTYQRSHAHISRHTSLILHNTHTHSHFRRQSYPSLTLSPRVYGPSYRSAMRLTLLYTVYIAKRLNWSLGIH